MDNATFSFSSNIFGYIAGTFSLIAMVLSVLLYRAHLPSNQIKALEEVLGQTWGIYEWADAAGLLPTTGFRMTVLCLLTDLQDDTCSLRERAYRATTLLDEYSSFVMGLSWEIIRKSDEVKTLRARILSTSEAERRKQQRRQNNCPSQTQLPDDRAIPPRPVQADTSYPPSINCNLTETNTFPPPNLSSSDPTSGTLCDSDQSNGTSFTPAPEVSSGEFIAGRFATALRQWSRPLAGVAAPPQTHQP